MCVGLTATYGVEHVMQSCCQAGVPRIPRVKRVKRRACRELRRVYVCIHGKREENEGKGESQRDSSRKGGGVYTSCARMTGTRISRKSSCRLVSCVS